MSDRRVGFLTMGGKPFTLIGSMRKVGDHAPDFTVLKDDLSPYHLSDAGDGIKIISVVPSLDTGVCETQTIHFNKEAAALDNVTILTISVDLPFAQQRFCTANKIDHVLTLSDHRDLDFGMKYGFVIEELRLLSRGVVILDGKNKIRYIEYVPEVSNQPDFDAALAAVHALIK